MLIKRTIQYSSSNNKMLDKLVEKLEKGKILDYEVVDTIPKDVISVLPNPASVKIYIPEPMEFSQYDIDDFIRSMVPYMRTSTRLERNVYVMKLSGSLNMNQLTKLVEFIIDTEDFCAILN